MDDYLVGCAAGGSGDRTDAAAPIVATLIERGQPGALIFENLAERAAAMVLTDHILRDALFRLGTGAEEREGALDRVDQTHRAADCIVAA